MDANGTRFHLIASKEDWLVGPGTASGAAVPVETSFAGAAYWDPGTSSLGLKPELSLFPRGRRSLPLIPADRRGAACDRFGTWYWIGQDRRTLFRAPAGTRRAVLHWEQPHQPPAPLDGSFGSPGAQPAVPPPVELSGLAVTTHHYLVAGFVAPVVTGSTSAGVLIFDLHSGGEPLRLEFPAGVSFAPFDLAAGPEGSSWVLDRANSRLWGLDRYFRLLSLAAPPAPVPDPGGFGPDAASPAAVVAVPTAVAPQGLLLPAGDTIAVEALPDGGLLLLQAPVAPGQNSRLIYYRSAAPGGMPIASPETVTLPGLAAVALESAVQPIVGSDLAYLPGPGVLYVVEEAGNQAIAYRLRLPQTLVERLAAEPLATYLPMHAFGKRSLATGVTPEGDPAVFYDVTPLPQKDLSVRWVRLQEITQPRYAREAWVDTPILDGHERGCTWHRLFLDACIPPETSVQVWTRTWDDPALLGSQAYRPEPEPYLRGGESAKSRAEIPFWDQWPDHDRSTPLPEGVGAWESLFQEASGRYLQIRLALAGNGRASPQIYRLRAYYPRFSYVKKYLPAAYGEDRDSASFMERLLANMEGFYAELEGKIAAASVLFDPRLAPVETLEWLAGWLGLVVDPLWSRIGEVGSSNVRDRRRLLIRFARQLYERRGTPDGIRFALLLLLDPCLERTLRRLEQAAVVHDVGLQQELAQLGLPYPTPATGEAEIEEILFRYVLTLPGRSRVRIVERWQTRGGLALQAGDVTGDGATAVAETLDSEIAHCFSVLVPEELPSEHFTMVDRIIRLEKPAHTHYDMRSFWDYFLVGAARLGIDTVLGEEGRFVQIVLGQTAVSEGYLEAAHPMNVTERAVSDRDRMGDLAL